MRIVRLINESSIAINFKFAPADDWAQWSSPQNLGVRKGDYLQLSMVSTPNARAPEDDWFQAEGSLLNSLDTLSRESILHMEGVVYESRTHYVPRRATIQSKIVFFQLIVHSFAATEDGKRKLWLPAQRRSDRSFMPTKHSQQLLLQYRYIQEAWKATGAAAHKYLERLCKAAHHTIQYFAGQQAPTLPLRVE